ncbi:EF-P lysine aminoacylase EpmA [Candidatus Neptunochlamydia vexilliferae]|uniref:Elongation factor P--(R)-beta-lysine ligase n=1 Tax=Candidatus Neptunichlamydia vexilliferae TaxID=1651774 RepID=A0ABS0AXU7_9BACT|nr:EF-P lysine aminoacylase EpmA [Candidatus Neptunochlamydia vexilliferae]MBF5058967.1 Elongation factor P--(R)-beta-lysine ligase [Candidatus Neptunochlamydia vexilliferae]
MSKTLTHHKLRAKALQKVRSFFADHAVLEVDTNLLSPYGSVDAHIDLFEVAGGGYLHSSPEYEMKKLLSKGSGDIYQLSHVYRKEEVGPLHRPEFTMIEWYRVGTTLTSFLEENLALLALFLGDVPYEILSYREAFEKHLGVPYDAPAEKLRVIAKEKGIELEGLNEIWGCLIEPHLGQGKVSIITPYPKEQVALAQTTHIDGEEVAERFEFYFKGIELGNGYHELGDPVEQKKRLVMANEERKALGKKPLPIDPKFIEALEHGLPDCYGIALGFDRLLMLQEGKTFIGS